MKFDPIHCPECGELAKGTVDLVPGLALLTDPDDDGQVDYEGETEIAWDCQETIQDEEGKFKLECSNVHNWFASLVKDKEA